MALNCDSTDFDLHGNTHRHALNDADERQVAAAKARGISVPYRVRDVAEHPETFPDVQFVSLAVVTRPYASMALLDAGDTSWN